MIISLIAAIDKNGVIGADGDLPWNIPSDLKKFKEITSYKPIIMGRKTWQDPFMPTPLKSRINVLVTNKEAGIFSGVDHFISGDIKVQVKKIEEKYKNFANKKLELSDDQIKKIHSFFKLPVKQPKNSYMPKVDNIEFKQWISQNVINHKIMSFQCPKKY